jgi:hypothetical protein
VGAQATEVDLRNALLTAAGVPDEIEDFDFEMEDGEAYPVAHYPPPAPGTRYVLTPAEVKAAEARVRALRKQKYLDEMEVKRKEKRQREIDDVVDWLSKNKLYRGEPPVAGENWEEYQARIAKRRRVDSEQRKQRVRVNGSDDAKRQRIGRSSTERSIPVVQEVVVDATGVSADDYYVEEIYGG